MIFKLGGLTVNVEIMNLFSGDGISFTINGEIAPKIQLDLYIDYAPKAVTKFGIRGSITEVVEVEDATKSPV
jgi:hypothetical protein